MTEVDDAENTSLDVRQVSRGRLKNFNDPLGLVMRLGSQSGRIGKGILARELLSRIIRPIDYMLKPIESSLLKRTDGHDLRMILIVGPPRSGTTLVHQVLASCLDVSYFTNFNAMFLHSPLAAAKYLQTRFDPGPGKTENLYGNTGGLWGANDAFHVWNRYLGSDRYDSEAKLPSGTVMEMRQFFAAWSHVTGKPILNKNNRNLAFASQLAEAFPSAHFIAIRREPLFVAQSLLKAREWVQGNRNIGWGLNSQNATGSDEGRSDLEAVCNQVVANEELFETQRGMIASQRWTEITYESFCENPRECVEQLASVVPDIHLRSAQRVKSLTSIPTTNSCVLPARETKQVEQLLSRN